MKAYVKSAIMFLGIVALVPVLLNPAPAHAEADVNAVAVCYANGTWSLRSWDDLGSLQRGNRRYVNIMIYHVQGGGLPNVVGVGGREKVGLRRTPTGLIVRRADFPPANPSVSQERVFSDNGDQTGTIEIDGPPASILGGMRVVFPTLKFNAPNYDDLTADCAAIVQSLRSELVPSDGIY